MMAMMIEPSSQDGDEKKDGGCPLRRVRLWHTIPLCLFAIVNILLLVLALLGLGLYRLLVELGSAIKIGWTTCVVAAQEKQNESALVELTTND
jgi:hypothetical protein